MASLMLGSEPRLDVGKVVEQTFAVLRRNFASFVLASLILVGIPDIIVGLIQLGSLAQQASGASLPKSGGGFITAFPGALLQAYVIYGVIRDMKGDPATVKDCLNVGWKKCPAVLGLSIVMGLGLLIGFVLLVIPGVLLALAWSVALPVRVMEGLGIRDTLRRSAELTKGRRGIILSLGLLIAVFYVIVGAVAYGLTGGFAGSSLVALILLSPVINIASTLIGAVMMAVLYQQLREGRDGVQAETVAEVFA